MTYPEAVLIPEGAEPRGEASTSFDADFFLVIHRAHSALFNNGGAGVLPLVPNGSVLLRRGRRGLDGRVPRGVGRRSREPAEPADHPGHRPTTTSRGWPAVTATPEQLGAAYAFLLTWGSVPSIYYGDEIGMRYLPGLPEKEGSIVPPGVQPRGLPHPDAVGRLGQRGLLHGADPADLYLPIDPEPDRPDRGRAAEPTPTRPCTWYADCSSCAARPPGSRRTGRTRVLHAGYPFAYLRGGTHLVVVNPRREPAVLPWPGSGAVPLAVEGSHSGRDGARRRLRLRRLRSLDVYALTRQVADRLVHLRHRADPPVAVLIIAVQRWRQQHQRRRIGAPSCERRAMPVESTGTARATHAFTSFSRMRRKPARARRSSLFPELIDFLKVAGQPVQGPWPPHQQPRPDPEEESMPVAVPDPEGAQPTPDQTASSPSH